MDPIGFTVKFEFLPFTSSQDEVQSQSHTSDVLVWCVRKKGSWSRRWLLILWWLSQFAFACLHLRSLQVRPTQISTCLCSIMVLSTTHFLLPAHSTFHACKQNHSHPPLLQGWILNQSPAKQYIYGHHTSSWLGSTIPWSLSAFI